MVVQTKSRAIGMALMASVFISILFAMIVAVILLLVLGFFGRIWTPTWPQLIWIHGSLLPFSVFPLTVKGAYIADLTQRDIEKAFPFLGTVAICSILAILISYGPLLHIGTFLGLLFLQLKEEWEIVGITIPGGPPTPPSLHPRVSDRPINRREYRINQK